MVRVRGSDGGFFHEPPYTPEEERDFYRRMSGGPKTLLHAPKPDPKSPQPKTPKLPRRPRAK